MELIALANNNLDLFRYIFIISKPIYIYRIELNSCIK